MASVWYPARDVGRYARAPWMLAAPLRALLASGGFDADVAVAPLTVGHEGAPVRRTGGRLPVVVYSHGAHEHRADNTIVVQELASHGYVVVTVDHTYDAFSEFPDGRLIVPSDDYPMYPGDFAEDSRFVLDQIEVPPWPGEELLKDTVVQLVIDDSGDRKDGTRTAHVGRQ